MAEGVQVGHARLWEEQRTTAGNELLDVLDVVLLLLILLLLDDLVLLHRLLEGVVISCAPAEPASESYSLNSACLHPLRLLWEWH